MVTSRKATSSTNKTPLPAQAGTSPAVDTAATQATAVDKTRPTRTPRKVVKPKATVVQQASKPKSQTVAAAVDKLPAKAKKSKLVRDSFTIPKTEFAMLDAIKQKSISLGHAAKKSEVLRAGILLLSALSDAALLSALKAVPAIKTGRPKG
jgi:hypothetical protein